MTRDEIILNNLSLVYFVLKKLNIKINSNDYEDLTNEGVIGLINAVDTFKEDKNVSFSTYAYTCIRNQILHTLKKSKLICISLSTEIGEGITIEDIIESNKPDILEKIILDEQLNYLKYLLDNVLNKEDGYLIKNLYGIGCNKKTQVVLAEELGCKQGNVSKCQNKLEKKLRMCYN